MKKHGSLFTGIGGFDLAAQWMGWENVFHCEINEFCRKVLHYYWPDAIQYSDIKTTDFKAHANTIDILTGGFPCQPYSTAGKRKGKEDERHLWPEMLRAIREIRPRWIVGENVRGLTNWNRGMVFDEVQADLEAEGYEILPFLLPACAVNAPHRRDRIWFIAHSEGVRLQGCERGQWEAQFRRMGGGRPTSNSEGLRINREKELGNDKGQGGEWRGCDTNDNGEVSGENGSSIATNSGNQGLQGRTISRSIGGSGKEQHEQSAGLFRTAWQEFPTVTPLCNGDDGISARVDTTSISKSKWRNESIKAGGNAVVPQIVYEIFKAIEQYEKCISNSKKEIK